MNIYLQELKMSRSSAVYWTVGLLLMMFIFMLMFPAIAKDAAVMQQIISKFPPELTKALGLSVLDLSSILGFYGFLFMYILLIGSVFAMKSGVSVLSEEVRAKATDFLVAKPVSRTQIVTAKLMSILTYILIQNVVVIIASILTTKIVSDQSYDQSTLLLINLSLLLVQLFFVALGMLVAVTIRKIKNVLPITLGVVFMFFILQLLNQSITDVKLSYITPFAYFDVPKIIETLNYDTVYLILDITIFIVLTALSYGIYNKKDMPSI